MRTLVASAEHRPVSYGVRATVTAFLSSLHVRVVRSLTRATVWWEIEHRRPTPKRHHTPCPLCGGPMLDLLAPISVKRKGESEITQVPARLSWKRCGACEGYQQGEMR